MKRFDFWNFYSRIYDLLRSFPPYNKMQDDVVNMLDLIPNLKILDLGCGTGNTIEKIVKTAAEKQISDLSVVGVDRSTYMLRLAGKKLKFYSGYRISLLPGDFNRLNQTEQTIKKYDRIISVNGLYASPDVLGTLQSWAARLAAGGLLVIVNPFVPRQWPIFREYLKEIFFKGDFWEVGKFIRNFPGWLLLIGINKIIAGKAKKQNFKFLSPNNLHDLVVRSGLEVLDKKLVYGRGAVLLIAQKNQYTRIRRAQTAAEIRNVYQIRYKIYCLEMNSVSAAASDNQEIDAFDSYATHFIAHKNQKIVGCLRLIPDYGRGFLLEEYFTLPAELALNRRGGLEISRAAILPDHRNDNLFLELMREAVIWGRDRGYQYYIGVSVEQIWEKLKASGWPIKPWADYIDNYHGIKAAPALIIPPAINLI